MQGAVGVAAVHVDHVLQYPHAQPVEVQVRVAGDERVEGPVHQAHAPLEQGVALKLLESAADAVVAQLGSHGEHVGPVDQPAVLDAGHAEHEAEEPVLGVEGAGRNAAEPLADLEDSGGNALAEGGAPGVLLQGDAGDEVFVGREVTHVQAVGRGGGLGTVHSGMRQSIQSGPSRQRSSGLRCTRLCTHYSPSSLGKRSHAANGRRRAVARGPRFLTPHRAYDGSPDTKAVPGDPLLVIHELADQVAARHITRVKGHVLIDISLFPEGERELGTGVVISPVAVNDNLVDVTVAAGDAPGVPVTVTQSPVTAYVRFVTQATTAPADSTPEIRWASDSAAPDGSHTVTVAGRMPAGKPAWLFSYAVPQPSRVAEVVLVEALKARGVRVVESPAGVRHDFKARASAYTPDNLVAEHVSPPLPEEAKC